MSGDGSAEVSVPTDLTVTSDGDSEEGYGASRRHARELQTLASDKAELQHVVQKQKLELQSKDAQLEALKREHDVAIAKTVAQKNDQISSKQIQVNRLEGELTRTREELSTIRERAARELAQLTQKCAVFQQNQKRLTLRQDELRASLANLQLSEKEFINLRHTPVQQLTLQQYTALRVYELVWPLRLKLNETEAVKASLESALSAKESDLKSQSDQCVQLQKNIEELQAKCEHYASQLMNLKDERRSEDYKVRNYMRVKTERDQLEEEKNSLIKKTTETELFVATLKKEHSILQERHSDLKSKARKQEHDLSQYVEDVIDLRTKLDRVIEDVNSSNKNLRLERERNEDLHEKYVAARGEITSLTENAQDYHSEIKLLREKLQSCTLQCSGLQERVSLLTQKNETLLAEIEKAKLKFNAETQALDQEVVELRSSLSSLSKIRDTLIDENSKLHQETQTLETSYQKEKYTREKETSDLNQELQKVRHILAGYEGLEIEYEKSIKAAAVLSEDEANKTLDRMLPGLKLVRNKALEQNVQLTRRVLLIERQNTEACTTIQKLTGALEHLRNTIASYKTALALAGQPCANLLERIASQDDQITTLQVALQSNSLSKSTLEEENKALSRDLIKLRHELDNMTAQTNEVSAIRQHLHTILESLPQLPTSHSQTQLHSGQFMSGNVSGPSERDHTMKTDKQGMQQPSTRAIIITKDAQKKDSNVIS